MSANVNNGDNNPHQQVPPTLAERLATLELKQAENERKRKADQAELERKRKADQAELERKRKADQAELERKRKADKAELERKRKADKAELEENLKRLKTDKTSKGTVTQAQFYQSIKEDSELRLEIDEGNVWSPKEGLPEWPHAEAPEEPADGARENPTVQDIVSKELMKLRQAGTDDDQFKSLPDPDAYKKVSFRRRKPDIVNYIKGKTGSLAISSFGDCKTRDIGDFTDEEKGHVLDMATSFMENVGYYNPFLVVYLTDGKRWQFFRVLRSENNLVYREGVVINDSKKGWCYYLGLLKADLGDIGVTQVSLQIPKNPSDQTDCTYELKKALGRGGDAVVYQAESSQSDELVLVKIFHGGDDKDKSFTAEKDALTMLNNSYTCNGVPKLQATAKAFLNLDPSKCRNAIIATPVGVPIAPPAGDGHFLHGKHLRQLVETVKEAHSLGLLHRDIKPDNVYLVGDKHESMLLNDWSSSCLESEEGNMWKGTLGFSVHFEEKMFNQLGAKARDLVSIVRTSHSLLFRQMPLSDGAVQVEEYWSEHLTTGSHWGTALQYAKHTNYDCLADLLFKMK